jgi:hypothetical protein
MKNVKYLLVLGVVLSWGVSAWAVTVPDLPAGYDYLKSRNADNGSTYVVSGLNPGDTFSFTNTALPNGVPTVVAGNLNGAPANATVTKFGALGAVQGEDSWGIALMYQIAAGHLNNPGSDGSIVGFTGPIGYDNSAGTQDTWLTAMFHSGVDTQVVVTLGNGTNGIPSGQQKETITTAGLKTELYAVDAAAIDANLAGAPKDSVNLADFIPASRTAVDQYQGWTGNTLPAANSVLLGTGTSDYFQSTVVVDGSGVIVSNSLDASTVYFDVPAAGPGIWNVSWGTSDQLLTPLGDPTNLWFQWTLDSGQRGWSVHSSDLGGAFAVPEPFTMTSVFLAVAGIGGYIRRRRKQAC